MSFILKSVVILISIGMIILGINLYITLVSLDTSPLIKLSNTDLATINDKWAVRGQIGDILSGHFSALAFLAVAISIVLQNQSNKQMRVSIEKQDESLKQQSNAIQVQTKSLEAQIAELVASREESSKQTEEFYIQNINIKLDRYYKILDEKLDDYKHTEMGVFIDIATLQHPKKSDKQKYEMYIILIKDTFDFAQAIFDEIKIIKNIKPQVYQQFIKEFELRIGTDLKVSLFAIALYQYVTEEEILKYTFLRYVKTEKFPHTMIKLQEAKNTSG